MAKNTTASPSDNISISNMGSSPVALHTERRMKFYCVYKGELNDLTAITRRLTVYTATASAGFTNGLALFVQWFFTEKPPAFGTFLGVVLAPLLAILGVVFLILARGENKDGRSKRTAIERESRLRNIAIKTSVPIPASSEQAENLSH